MDIEEILEAEYQVSKDIIFISEQQIDDRCWAEAHALVYDIDIKDIQYLAYAKQFRCKIWSGDKKLISGLKKKGFTGILTTDELFDLKNSRSK